MQCVVIAAARPHHRLAGLAAVYCKYKSLHVSGADWRE
jgi:hypothetical protein